MCCLAPAFKSNDNMFSSHGLDRFLGVICSIGCVEVLLKFAPSFLHICMLRKHGFMFCHYRILQVKEPLDQQLQPTGFTSVDVARPIIGSEREELLSRWESALKKLHVLRAITAQLQQLPHSKLQNGSWAGSPCHWHEIDRSQKVIESLNPPIHVRTCFVICFLCLPVFVDQANLQNLTVITFYPGAHFSFCNSLNDLNAIGFLIFLLVFAQQELQSQCINGKHSKKVYDRQAHPFTETVQSESCLTFHLDPVHFPHDCMGLTNFHVAQTVKAAASEDMATALHMGQGQPNTARRNQRSCLAQV